MFVIEGDEYDSAYFDKTAKFLKYLPDIAVINNIEFDHADIYADLDEVRLAFRRLVNLVPRQGLDAAGHRQSRKPRPLWPLRAQPRADLWPVCGRRLAGERGSTPAAGASGRDRATRVHRVGSDDLGVFSDADGRRPQRPQRARGDRRSASTWASASRPCDQGLCHVHRASNAVWRSSATRRGVTVYDDFAHHPTAVAETAARRFVAPTRARRIWAIFEPRSASSCRRVFQGDFARAFAAPTRSCSRRCFDRRCRSPSGLSESRAGGRPAARLAWRPGTCPVWTRSSRRVAAEAREGDLVARDVQRRVRRHSPEARCTAPSTVPNGVLRVIPCGDSMLLVEFEASIDPVINDRVIALGARLRSRHARGVLRRRAGLLRPRRALRSAADRSRGARAGHRSRRGSDRVDAGHSPPDGSSRSPSSYGGEMRAGPRGRRVDWPAATAARSSSATLAALYRVYMLGFVPGFAYMGRVDPSIAVSTSSCAARACAGRALSGSPVSKPVSIQLRAREAGN